MTTATTTTVVNHTTTAGFRVWVAEIIAQWLAVGLTQTADTGQINTATVNRPAVNTMAGYAIFRFNDTAQATSPIFIKLEFGTGSSANNPAMLVTVGTASNGTGTITGTVLDRVSVSSDTAPVSTVLTYVSRFCYKATQGFFGFGWKYNAGGTTGTSLGGLFIFRSTDTAGAPTTDAAILLTNSSTTSGSSGNPGYMQVISYLTSTAYASAIVPWPSSFWTIVPFQVTSTLYTGNQQVFPVFQFTPVIGISASAAIAVQAEIGVGSTVVLALIGATTHTFIQAGGVLGGTSLSGLGISATTFGMLMLWE